MRKQSAWMQRGVLLTTTFLLIALSLPAAVFAARGGTAGKPGGWPEGEGPPAGKGPKTGGGDTRKGDLFGDPMLVVRDLGPSPVDEWGNPLPGGNGQPVYFKWVWPETAYLNGELTITPGVFPIKWEIPLDQADPNACIQPISLDPLQYPLGTEIVDQTPYIYYDYLDSYGEYPDPVYLIPLDAECKIPEAYTGTWGEQVEEVDTGRLNLARTTQSVIDSAYAEAIATINTAVGVNLDAAGRLLLTLEGDVLKTIDSPRENLALYQKLMQWSCLTGLSENAKDIFTGLLAPLVVCDANNEPSTADLLRAASLLAGAADKFGHVGIDEVVYINTLLRINTVETQADGSLLITGYKNMGNLTYSRLDVHGSTTARLLQPVGESTTQFNIEENVGIYPKIFEGPWNYWAGVGGLPSYPLMNFVRAADDAVSIIYYIHNFEPPIAPVPQVP